jgi:hypothetical protein
VGLTGEEHWSDRCATTQSGDFEAEDTRRGRMACVVEATPGVVAGYPSDGATTMIPKVPLGGMYPSVRL